MAKNADKAQRLMAVLDRLRSYEQHGDNLNVGNPFWTLVGVVLSARTRDEQVLKALPSLIAVYPDVRALSRATSADVLPLLKGIGMPAQKAKHIVGLSTALVNTHGGVVPKTMDELTALPGVGRKTASVVLASQFGIAAVAVDTHVARILSRLGVTRSVTPEKIEAEVLSLLPAEYQSLVNRIFVPFGRAVCTPGKPRCFMCPVADLCPFTSKNLTPAKTDAIDEANARQQSQLARLKADVMKLL